MRKFSLRGVALGGDGVQFESGAVCTGLLLLGFRLSLGFTLLYLTILVLVPLGACVAKAATFTPSEFLAAAWTPRAQAAYAFTFAAAVTWRSEAPWKPWRAKSSSAADRIRSLVEKCGCIEFRIRSNGSNARLSVPAVAGAVNARRLAPSIAL